jgi:hypothetical protein
MEVSHSPVARSTATGARAAPKAKMNRALPACISILGNSKTQWEAAVAAPQGVASVTNREIIAVGVAPTQSARRNDQFVGVPLEHARCRLAQPRAEIGAISVAALKTTEVPRDDVVDIQYK